MRAAHERTRALRASGIEPITPEVRARIAATQGKRRGETSEWNRTHDERPDPAVFRRDVLPAIEGVTLRELVRRTGLSIPYLSKVRRGVETPHARWWRPLLGESEGHQGTTAGQ